MFKKEMSYAHTPKTLFVFHKEDEATILKNVKVASSYECKKSLVKAGNDGKTEEVLVYATLKCSKDKADFSAIQHLLVGQIAGA